MAERGLLEQAVQKRAAPLKEPPKAQVRGVEAGQHARPEELKLRPPTIPLKVEPLKEGQGATRSGPGERQPGEQLDGKRRPSADDARATKPVAHWASGEPRPLQRKKSPSPNEPHVLKPRQAAGEKTRQEGAFAQAGKQPQNAPVQRDARMFSPTALPIARPSSAASGRPAPSDEEQRALLEAEKSGGDS